MADPIDISELYLEAYRVSSITAYNRLEPSPRIADFDRSLSAEIRDPLWMLTRQWQFGEFQGEDAASPLTAQILGEHMEMQEVQFPDNSIFAYNDGTPLETCIERERLTGSLFLGVQMGRYFLKLMKQESLEVHLTKLTKEYPLAYLPEKNDVDGIQLLTAVKDKIFDGFLLHKAIITFDGPTTKFQQWMASVGISTADQAKFNTIGPAFTSWYERNYNQPVPGIPGAWLPSQLEYQFQLKSGEGSGQKKLVVDQYYEGHLDWYSFDLNGNSIYEPATENNKTTENLVSFIPAPVAFKGMPNPRFWMMEEGQTDFGKIDTSPTGLLHLMIAEFGLIYSNDWFMLPYPLLINTLCELKGMVIMDVFGQHTFIRASGEGNENNWQRWTMFHHTDINNSRKDTNSFYLVPAVNKVLEGDPLEQINFLRDEMANLVWGIETTVPSQAGKGVNGDEMALKETESEPFTPAGNAAIRYVLGSTAPNNWIPFIPVHMEGSNTEIRLQRARIPGGKGALGVILNEKVAPYYINEEEIPRSGVIVKRMFQRARWINGEIFLWLGRYKEAGKGEGWSNLKFDQIENIPQTNTE